MAVYISNSVADTEALAARLAEKLRGGEVIAFTGSMGMGKTAFTRGLVAGSAAATSSRARPSRSSTNTRARLTVQHFDMYRVSGWDDLYSTGFFDYLDTGSVLVIEWSENIDGALPDDVIRIDMQKGEAEIWSASSRSTA